MKKITLILILALLYGTVNAQCPPGNVTLNTQQEVDDFAVNYPNCTSINGTLKIKDGSSLITDLNGLNQITSIAGDLMILQNNSLPDLIGLDQLTSVGGNLEIGSNFSLTDLDGLSQIISVGGDLEIRSNASLTNFNGLNQITSIVGDLRITDNASLTNLNGLNQITSIVGDLRITDNVSLISLDELSQITSVGGVLSIGFNDSLISLDGLNQLTSIGDAIYIRFNDLLISLDGLDQVTSIGDDIYIASNASLANLDGLDQITLVETSAYILSNASLTNLDGLNQLTSVGANIHIGGNTSLTNLDGLNQLTSVGGYLYVRFNDSLISLNGLSNLTTINGDLDITENAVISDISGLENLDPLGITDLDISNNPNLSFCGVTSICNYLQNQGTYSFANNASGCNSGSQVSTSCNNLTPTCSDTILIFTSQAQIDDFEINNPTCTIITGDIYIYNSTDITNLNGLSQITSIEGSLMIENNALLTDFAGLGNLTSIEGSLMIENNALLTDFTDLSNLTSIGSVFSIVSNPVLMSFEGLENLNYTTILYLIIKNNNTLGVCGIQEICDYLENDGLAEISNNAPGCNSKAEVLQICGLPAENQCDLQIDSTFTYTQPPDLEYNLGSGYTGVAGYHINDLTTMSDGRIFAAGCVSYAGAYGQTTSYLNYDLSIYEITESGNLVDVHRFSEFPPNPMCANHIVESNGNLIYSTSSKLFCFDPNNANTPCAANVGSYIQRLVVQTDGKILVGTSAGNILRYMSDLTPDLAFNGNADVSAVNAIRDIDVLQTGQILVTGTEGITRLNNDGTTDTTFGTNGLITNTELGVNPNKSVELPTGDYAVINYDNSTNYSVTYVSSGGMVTVTNQYTMPTGTSGCYYGDILALPTGEILIGTDCDYNGYLAIIHPDGTVSYSDEKAGILAFQGSEILLGGNLRTTTINLTEGNTAIVKRYRCELDLLPIEMVSPFQVRLKNQTALLTWRTETETNNSGFEIQRSQDGINWERIGWQAGQGTTNTRHSYTYADTNPYTGISYYRLKQVDFDGQFSYSNAVSLRYIRSQVEVFPNPVKDKLYILTNETTIDKVLIFNTMGQQIDIQFDGNAIDVSLLSAGLYTVKVNIEGEDFCEKIVVE